MGAKILNFVRTKLTAQLLVGGTSAAVTTGDGNLFASVNFANDYVVAILRHQSGYQDTYREIVWITNRASDTLTITRARESTVAAQFEIGDYLDVDVTAGLLAGLYFVPTGFADGLTPTGAIDGVNAVFTAANAPSPAGSLQVFINGVLQLAGGVHYTLAGSTITFVAAATPQAGDNLRVWYRY